ncbi:MAG: hypothetical protein QM817_13400 [Archangium sp.]
MLTAAALAVALTLSQDPEPGATPPADPAPSSPAAPADGATGDAPAAPAAPVGPPKPKGADEVARIIQKMPSMSETERRAAAEQLVKQFGQTDSNPVLPTADIDLEKYIELPPPQQAEVVARGFFQDLISGDTNRLVARAGYPFFMEARRVDRPEDLRGQWARSLRSRRTDLVKLYSAEVFTPADMEKKYGKPPQRLSSWPLRSGTTFLVVGNLSGHAAILLLRQAGAAWQVVGFHD